MPSRNEESYVAFVRSSYERLRRSAYLMTGDSGRAEDAVQEALLKLYRLWPRLEREGGIPTYARRTLMHIVIDQSRRPWRREVVDGTARHDHAATTDETDPVVARQTLMTALRTLPPRQRACVVLRHLEELSVVETADALGCSEGTVKSQTARALDHLRRHLGPELVDEPDASATTTGRTGS